MLTTASFALIAFTCVTRTTQGNIQHKGNHTNELAVDSSCVSATNQSGVCMFAIDCKRKNGRHVAICVDRMFVKSCCVLTNNIPTSDVVIDIIGKDTLNSQYSVDEQVPSSNKSTSDKNIRPTTEKTSSPSSDIVVNTISSGDWILVNTSTIQYQSNLTTTQLPTEVTVDQIDNDSTDFNVLQTFDDADDATTTTTTTTTTTMMDDLDKMLKLGMDLHSDVQSESVCGHSVYKKLISSRIVGGTESKFAKWPWQISLRRREDKMFAHSCGASLLNKFWIVTAAHCVQHTSRRQLMIRLGEFDQSTENEPLPHIDISVSNVVIHPNYDERSFRNDIALLRLSKATPFRANILPVCLPSGQNNNSSNFTAFVTGWGQLFAYGPYPRKLHEVQVPIISNDQCRDMFKKSLKFHWSITDSLLCAATPEGGKDSCEGDSGGPMVIQRSDGRWELIGTISWGVDCAQPGMPGVYTRVAKFVEWIEAVINE